MTTTKSILMGAALFVGTIVVAGAQPLYQGYPYPQVAVAPPSPPSWSYDPYTSGLGPCPQRFPSDPPCSETMRPTYGQPSYWPAR